MIRSDKERGTATPPGFELGTAVLAPRQHILGSEMLVDESRMGDTSDETHL